MKEFEAASTDLKQVLHLEPGNGAARKLLQECQQAIGEVRYLLKTHFRIFFATVNLEGQKAAGAALLKDVQQAQRRQPVRSRRDYEGRRRHRKHGAHRDLIDVFLLEKNFLVSVAKIDN